MITALWRRWISTTGAAMVAVTAWIAFKHSYVRSDWEHAPTFFCFAILVFAFLLAQMNYTRARLGVFGSLFAAFTVFALQAASQPRSIWTSYWWSPANNLTQAFQLVQWNHATRKLEDTSKEAFRTAVVNDYDSVIRNSRVLFFPWEVSYGMRGGFHTVPLFALQGYAAYTHFLDEQSAIHIREATPPIDFVMLEWESIDSRNMLLDVPGTWNALFSIFVPVSSNGGTILLKHRARPLAVTFQEIQANACRADEWVEVPPRKTPVAASVRLQKTLAGQAISTLYQLKTVNLEVETRSGIRITSRFTPDVLSGPFPINYLPLNSTVLNTLWTGNLVTDPIVRFRFLGPGTRYLNCKGIWFYDVLGTSIVIA